MNEVYINCKYFKNDDFSIMFGKDLISVEDLVDKIYELSEELEEKQEEIEKLKDELIDKQDLINDLKDFKNGTYFDMNTYHDF